MSDKNTIELSIVSPLGEIFDGNVESVVLPGSEGEFGVLAKHSSLVTTLSKGIVKIVHADKKKESVAIDWGYCEVDNNKVYILANNAVTLSKDGKIADKLEEANKLLEDSHDEHSNYINSGYLKQEISKILK